MVEKLQKNDRKIKKPLQRTESEDGAMLTNQTMELHFVRNKLESLQSTILRDVEKRMSGMIDEVMQDLRQHELQTHEFRNFAPSPRAQGSNRWSNRTYDEPAQTTATTQQSSAKTSKIFGQTLPAELTKGHNTSEEDSDHISQLEQKQHSKVKQCRTLPPKDFRMRESYLTALLQVDHMRTINHIFYIIFLVFWFDNLAHDYFVNGSVTFGLNTFKHGFAKIHYVLGIWLLQKSFTFCIYYALRGWASVRSKLAKHKSLQHAWSLSCLTLYIVTQLLFAYIPTQLCLRLDLPFVTASTLLLETIRMLMKMHSFVRTIAARVVMGKPKVEPGNKSSAAASVPAFGKYLYFLFAPTILYRDSYPRTAVIRWKFALARFLEVVAVAFLYSSIYEHHIKPHFANFGREEINISTLLVKQFAMMMPCIVIYLTGFYMILHSWMNFAAELLRFGDRMFYRDWWTATNYAAYYRNWNVVVHDWLYEYVYTDFYTYVFRGKKMASSLSVFAISALFHEYILGYALQVVFPVMFVLFGVVGVLMIFITRFLPKNIGNMMLWFSLIYGNCVMICLYSAEYFASKNCPKESYDSWTDRLVPHVWSCYNK